MPRCSQMLVTLRLGSVERSRPISICCEVNFCCRPLCALRLSRTAILPECVLESGCAQTLRVPQTGERSACRPLVVVSMFSCRERNPILRVSNASTRAIRSLRDRPNRSSRQTTLVSPFLANSKDSFKPGRSAFAPLIWSEKIFHNPQLAKHHVAVPDSGRLRKLVRSQSAWWRVLKY